jgi:hypothetical protein
MRKMLSGNLLSSGGPIQRNRKPAFSVAGANDVID